MISPQLRIAVFVFGVLFFGLSTSVAQDAAPNPDQFPAVPGLEQDLRVRDGLARSGAKFRREKTGLVAYVGGSITNMTGWTQMIDEDLQKRFPETKFTFVHAGIPSVDSSGHAFRLVKDVLQQGIPDLLFIEAAVNDLHNGRTNVEQLRGMEGVVRRALRANRNLDIVMLHFAEPRYNDEYAAGKTPTAIANHEKVAEHYQIPSIDLAHEVQQRIAAGQFDWKRDFRDLHPAPFGHRLYYLAVRRLFDHEWKTDAAKRANGNESAERTRDLPPPLDRFSYDQGELVSPERSLARERFDVVANWKPTDKAGTRPGFVDVPMWVADGPGSGFSFRFEGRGVGLFLTAGPDTPVLEYRIDQGEWKQRDSFTQWSGGLHLPWVLMLETELKSGPHQLDLRLAAKQNPAAKGAALRVRDIVVNGPAYDLPKMSEIKVRSSLDGTEQPSLVWAPPAAATAQTPVLVYLHSWSSDYKQDNSPWQAQAVQRGWIYLHPNFRGVNRRPEACGSKLARQDIIDALDYVQKQYRVDASRVYLAGTSGGGHMALLMASYYPERFSAVSAWVGISDLADWHDFHVKEGRPDHYAQMTRDALGGEPNRSPATAAQYRERSPRFHLARAAKVPIDIAAGVMDGKTGSVPIRHSVWAFNELAQAQHAKTVSDDELDQLWKTGKLTNPTAEDQADDATLGRSIFLRRQAGRSRLTIFDGGHEGLAPAACHWLSSL